LRSVERLLKVIADWRTSLPEGDVTAARAKRSARPGKKEFMADRLNAGDLEKRAGAAWRAGESERSSCYSNSAKGGPMAETRKLAAILAADVVGFSRLTGANEDRALRSDLIDPTISVHNGRVI
jgi:class 3 adenylate cyclase